MDRTMNVILYTNIFYILLRTECRIKTAYITRSPNYSGTKYDIINRVA